MASLDRTSYWKIAVVVAVGISLGSYGLARATSTFITQQGGTGTTSPSGILYGDNGSTNHLNTVTIGSNLTFTGGTLSATGGSGTVSTSSSETASYIPFWTSTNGTPALLSGGDSALIWDNTNKRLGIGQAGATPSAFLDVHSNTNTVATVQANNVGTQGASGGGLFQILADPGAAINSGSRLGALRYAGATDGASTFYSSAIIEGFATENWSGTAGGSKIIFGVTPNTTHSRTTAMTIDQTGFVGVGSTSPGSLLSIGGNGTGWNFVDGLTSTTTAQGNLHVVGNIQVDGSFYAPVNLVSSGDATINGNLTVTGLSSALVVTGAGGLMADYAGTSCTNQFIRSLSALGVATCATVTASDVSLANLTATDGTLTFSGTYDGSTARTIGINLGNANTWTALQQFSSGITAYATSTIGAGAQETGLTINGGATTTLNHYFGASVGIGTTSPGSILSIQGVANFVANAASKIYNELVGCDATNGWCGRISPTHTITLGAATTTTWTATTSNAYAFATSATLPWTGTVQNVQCAASSTGAFLGVQPFINQTAMTPAYWVASTTKGTIVFTGNNTFVKGDQLLMYVGTSTPHAALGVNCSFNVTETP